LAMSLKDSSIGGGCSPGAPTSGPGFICSHPMTRAQSTAPFLTRDRARLRPVDPVAQALLVL
jgi:hypothetical protein